MTTDNIQGIRDPAETSSPAGSARAQLGQVKDQVVDQARDSFRQARDVAGSSLADSRKRAADQIGGVATALRTTSEHLRAENHGSVADLTESLSRHADQTSSYLRNSDAQKMRGDLERLVRDKPAAALGFTFVAGLLAARFFKSSERRRVTSGGGHA